MMLTWKIFVIIMSMVFLTFEMNPSGEGSSSVVGSSSDKESSSGERIPLPSSEFQILDPTTGQYFRSAYNLSNPFRFDSLAYICFDKLRLYCKTKNDAVTSDDCAKQGILYYKYQDFNQLKWIDDFFLVFPLDPGNFDLPKKFCKNEACRITNKVEYDESDEVAVQIVSKCTNDLRLYIGNVLLPYYADDEEAIAHAESLSRMNIAKFALRMRELNGLPQDSFERNYLRHISEIIKSGNGMD